MAYRLKRLLFRMLGIYHGATLDQPAGPRFFGGLAAGRRAISSRRNWTLGYETAGLSFMDLYFLNAFSDLMDVISFSPELAPGGITTGGLSGQVLRLPEAGSGAR